MFRRSFTGRGSTGSLDGLHQLLDLKLCRELARFEDPSFGDNAGNQFRWGDVEGGVVD